MQEEYRKSEGKRGRPKSDWQPQRKSTHFTCQGLCTHLCTEHLCSNFVRMGFNQATDCKKIWGFDFATKISESEKGNCSWLTHLSYIVWPLKYVSIPLFHVLTSISCSIQPFIKHHLNFLPSFPDFFLPYVHETLVSLFITMRPRPAWI